MTHIHDIDARSTQLKTSPKYSLRKSAHMPKVKPRYTRARPRSPAQICLKVEHANSVVDVWQLYYLRKSVHMKDKGVQAGGGGGGQPRESQESVPGDSSSQLCTRTVTKPGSDARTNESVNSN